MIDGLSATLALRARALGVSVCTTGSTTLAGTATGYSRLAGSFITDGFRPGMEITTASGFVVAGNNVSSAQGKVVTAVTALTLSCAGCATDVSAAGRTLTVGLPYDRAWENIDFTPTAGRPYVEEDFIPATAQMISGPYEGGDVEETGLYVLRIYGLANYGVGAIRKTADAIKALYAPGTSLTSGTTTVRVRGDVGPWAGQLLPQGDGWTVSAITVPWRSYTINTIAA